MLLTKNDWQRSMLPTNGMRWLFGTYEASRGCMNTTGTAEAVRQFLHQVSTEGCAQALKSRSTGHTLLSTVNVDQVLCQMYQRKVVSKRVGVVGNLQWGRYGQNKWQRLSSVRTPNSPRGFKSHWESTLSHPTSSSASSVVCNRAACHHLSQRRSLLLCSLQTSSNTS